MKDECIYVIGTPGSTVVKIGRTMNLPARFAAIRAMSPIHLEVLWTHPGGSALETSLHRHFARQRLHGEWFDLNAEPTQTVRTAVDKLCRTQETKSQPLSQEATAQWLRKLDEISAEHLRRRAVLDELVADARRAGVPLTAISEHTPYSREWARRIASRVNASRPADQAPPAKGE